MDDRGDPCGIPACWICIVSDLYCPTNTDAVRSEQKLRTHPTSSAGICRCCILSHRTSGCTPLNASWTSKVTRDSTLPPLHALWICSTIMSTACSLDFFGRPPKWFAGTRLNVSVKKESLLATIFSSILLTVGRSDVGLYAFGAV
jgi:hypothetical protein